MQFKDKTALITGASSGIGAQFAQQLHSRGANVILVARRKDKLKELCRALNAQRPESAAYTVIDLCNTDPAHPESICELEKLISQTHIDILVNNAGRGSFEFFEKLDIEQETQMVALNVIPYMRLCHAVIPR